MKNIAFFLIPLTLVYTSCPPAIIYQQSDPSGGTYQEYPISIEIQGGDIAEGVEVFEAEVSVYRMNNRTDTSLKLDKTYNLIIQEAYGERITRIDYTDGRPAEYSSIISFGNNAVTFNPKTEEISHKININQPENPAYRLLRSQNYLSKINLPDEYNKLKGVITISGANKGFKALEGGFNVFKYKIYNFLDVIANGLIALNVFEIEPSLTYLYKGNFSSAYTLQNPAVLFFLSLIPGPLGNYIVPVLSTDNYDEVAEIRDLVPFSRFANTYVADANVNIYKYVTGTVPKLKLLPFPHFANENVYGYYSVYSDEKIQFSKDLPVAYIIGTDSDTLGMIGDSEVRQKIEKTIDVLAVCFETAEIYYDVISWATLGLSDLFTDTLRSRINAGRAKDRFKDFNGALDRLLGSPESDGLLARESMHYTSGNVRGREYVYANHMTIEKHGDTKIYINYYLERMLKLE